MLGVSKLETKIQCVTNQDGEKTAVIVPYEDFQELLEDLAAVAGRRDEPSMSHDEVRASFNLG